MNNPHLSNDELYHYGILGMRWGIRRFQPYGKGGYTPKKKESLNNNNKLIKIKRKQDMKNRRNMSDNDLKKTINRLQMEKQLKELTEEDINPGKIAIKRTLRTIGNRTIPTIASGAFMYIGYSILSGKSDRETAAKYIFPNINLKKK